MDIDRRAAAAASLHGLAVGDALGASFFVPDNHPHLETLSLPPGPWPWTDDTEMACSVYAMLADRGKIDQDALAAAFAEHHDFDRGYGPGANRMLRLIRQEGGDWRELSAEAFGGLGSWGNGGAMRVAPLGAFFAADGMDRVVAEAAASAEVTHRHPEGVAGAIAVAVAAAATAVSDGAEFLRTVAELTPPGLVRDGVLNALSFLHLEDPRSAAAVLGNGREVSAQETVPFCLWVVAKFGMEPEGAFDDVFERTFWVTAGVGGDVDTNCAIVGGIIAARTGMKGIPAEWLRRREPLPSWAGVRDW